MDKDNIGKLDLNIPSVQIPPQEEFLKFKKNVEKLINLDLTNYKNAQMERRIVSFMNKHKIFKLDDYFLLLKNSEEQLAEFVNMLTINVSEFFRNPEKFVELKETYLKEMIKSKPNLKIWSAGCSIGAEVYSVAMILDELGALGKCQLIASDFDQKILNKAQSGIYSKEEVGTVPVPYKKYFTVHDEAKGTYVIDKKITSSVKFQRQDLLNSHFEKGFDMIICRNVVIYFTDEAKDKLYQKFSDALIPGGYLFIGSTERINNHKAFGLDTATTFFYKKT